MARIRTIKPDFWTDETITDCSVSARLLLLGTRNFADDRGNLEHSVKQLKMRVFPGDDIKVLPLLNDLIAHGLLIEYSVSGKKYLHINNFEKEQVINRPSISSIPKFDNSLIIHGTLTEDSLREGKGREGRGKEGNKSTPEKLGVGDLVDMGIPLQAAQDWMLVRKAKGAPLTRSAIDGVQSEADKAKITLAQAVAICAKKSWQGFNASWDWKDSMPKRSLAEIIAEEDAARAAK